LKEVTVNSIKGTIAAVCTSEAKGTQKEDVGEAFLVVEKGLEGDAHAGFAHRQVSLLTLEDIETAKEKLPELRPGSFAENLTVQGLDLSGVAIGDRLRAGEALLEISQIGKTCHTKCEIYHKTGDCIMPRKGLFCRVLEGGWVRRGDSIELLPRD
jgi:MOSC domain-containing protein YiiM